VKVGFDVSPPVQPLAGTARYDTGLGAALERLPDLEVTRLSFGGPGRASALARDLAWYLALLPRHAGRAGLDVIHCTSYRAPLRSRVPVVVTVHDLAVLRHPELFPAWTRLYSRTWLRPTLRAAARVIAVSEFTGREVVELAGVPADRVRVVANATDETVFTSEGPRVEGDYVLALGTLEPRKNLARLAEATHRLGLELRVVGATGWGDVSVGVDSVRWLGRLDDAEVAALYRGALCFAYPSLYEGFGIPVLEAMRCGTPVVTSAGSAMEEVVGEAAELVDPLDPAAIAAGIQRAIERRDELRAAGLERARGFSWDAAARATADVYREVVR
jgi:glycosyltransferase involved in cell wall biosynthesis